MNRFQLIVSELAGMLLLSSACVSSAVVVYDNTSGFVSWVNTGTVGQTVTLAGTSRYITCISLGVGGPVSDDQFEMTLWTTNGPNGTSGRLLWDSGLVGNLPFAGGLVSFDVPLILVPDTFIYMVSHTDPADVCFYLYDPPTVGSSPDYIWGFQGMPLWGWTNLEARIDAMPVPEPSIAGFLALSFLIATGRTLSWQQ
jgi:hypothetical protein